MAAINQQFKLTKLAKDMGILTVAVVTKPFFFEGPQRARNAEIGIEELAANVDAIVTIPNDLLLKTADKKIGIKESFKLADEVLRQGVEGIIEVIAQNGIISCDFADVSTIMRDSGVAHIKDISFIGEQRNFDRRLSYSNNDNDALGSSYSDYETEVVAGNTFDYPALHGRSIAAAGFSYCSTSARAIERGEVEMGEYKIADIILGKQRSYSMGRGTSGVKFKVFPEALQDKIREYTLAGGAVMATGCYVASDLWNGVESDGEDRGFARSVLHYSYSGDMATRRGEVRVVASPMNMSRLDIKFNQVPSATHYGVESPGCIMPVGREAFIAMRYPRSNQPAAIGYKGKDYRTFVMALPFESIIDEAQRDKLMLGVLNFFDANGATAAE